MKEPSFTIKTWDEVKKENAAYNAPEAVAQRLADIKALINIGLKVEVENARHEILVPGKVVRVDDDGFTIEVNGRKILSQWQNASFTRIGKSKNKIVLFDSSHLYASAI